MRRGVIGGGWRIVTVIVVILLGLVGGTMPTQAAEENFPAGSLIIPMDSHYQPEDDGGILEAYGLVYYLLAHVDANGDPDITIYWIINDQKTTVDGVDVVIEDLTLTDPTDAVPESTDGAVVKYYNHDNTSQLLGAHQAGNEKTYRSGDTFQRVTYSGAPFIIHQRDAAKAKEVINHFTWAAVDVHEAQVPFKANVHREMIGTPPRIALMNNDEDPTSGNAAILEAYLRLAGICTDVYEIITPNQVRDGILQTKEYDFLWAPHWAGYEKNGVDADGDGVLDVEEIVANVRQFLEAGKALFAECASIEVFEHSENGHFLSTHGFGHNGGTMDPATIVYNNVIASYPQVADYQYVPEGGHLHNWRPFVKGVDETTYSNKLGSPPTQDSAYHSDVTRFVSDDTGWDYYVGGHLDGDTSKGYVVYLGGHKYAQECSTSKGGEPPSSKGPTCAENRLRLQFEFTEKFEETLTFTVLEVNGEPYREGDPFTFDFSSSAKDGDKKIKDIIVTNESGSEQTITSIKMTWEPEKTDRDKKIKLKKIKDTTNSKDYDNRDQESGHTIEIPDGGLCLAANGDAITGGEEVSATTSGGDTIGCTDNAGCSWKNIAGVRFVLNTLFDIKFMIISHEYVRSAPVIRHPYLYQGSYEWPSWRGHFRRYDVTATTTEGAAEWDTADAGHIPDPQDGNGEFNNPLYARQVFTSQRLWDANNDKWVWGVVDFEQASLDTVTYQDKNGDAIVSLTLRQELAITPDNGDDTDEIRVVERLRGRTWDAATGSWKTMKNLLGGIVHSSPVIVSPNSRTNPNRSEVAYVGDVTGMLHAIDTESGDEKWAFIPRHQLDRLQNDRADANAVQNFAGIDASPVAKDVYFDHDGDGTKEWRTVLIVTDGAGGNGLTVLDVTDPDYDTSAARFNWKVLWEFENPEFGAASKAAINQIKVPVYDAEGNVTGHEEKQVVFVSTGFTEAQKSSYGGHGGINVFALDLATGNLLWHFLQDYASAINDIPGAVTLYDVDGDSYMDYLYVGDMEGRLWELSAVDGSNPSGVDGEQLDLLGNPRQIPLWNAGSGNPISVSPAVTRINPVIVIFGTGGTDWASDSQQYAVYAVRTDKQPSPTYSGGSGTLYWKWELPVGEKVWSAPTITKYQVFIATSYGKMESAKPSDDLTDTRGKLYEFSLKETEGTYSDGSAKAKKVHEIDVEKVRGSLYVDREHLYMTTVTNKIYQFGGNTFGKSNIVSLKAWRQLN